MQFARELLRARRAAQLSQSDLAEIVGCSNFHISLMESAKRLPGTEGLALKMAAACGVEPARFLQPLAHDRLIACLEGGASHLPAAAIARIRTIATESIAA